MDITISARVNAPTDDLGDPGKNQRRYIDGDVVRVYETATIATKQGNDWILNSPVGTSALVFVHITGVPDGFLTFQEIKNLLEGSWDQSSDPDNPDIIAVREWNLDMLSLPPPNQNELTTDKQTTVKWNTIKNKVARKVDSSLLQDLLGG